MAKKLISIKINEGLLERLDFTLTANCHAPNRTKAIETALELLIDLLQTRAEIDASTIHERTPLREQWARRWLGRRVASDLNFGAHKD